MTARTRAGQPRPWSTVAVLITSGIFVSAAEIPKAPVPASPFMPVIYRYADTLLDRGRDTFGPQKTGQFLSALDRHTLSPLTNRPAAPPGIRETDRAGASGGALTGANVQHEENLLRLLYALSELSSKPKYSNAAAATLSWVLEHSSSVDTPARTWIAGGTWDVFQDEPIAPDGLAAGTNELFRPWLLWDRCFDLAPSASKQFAVASSALMPRIHTHARSVQFTTPRQAGFCLRTWAVAYRRTQDRSFLSAIEGTLSPLEQERHSDSTKASVASTLSLAIDCDGSAHDVPGPLATRLRALAAREDDRFCSLPHNLRDTRGFVAVVDATGKGEPDRTSLWSAPAGNFTTAQMALMCVSRYENTGRVGYRELIHAAADAYLAPGPGEETDLWPGTIGQIISLQLAAWRSTAQPKYLERARELGRFALEKFFDQSPLPRASLKSDHYETITGADTLALALVELHLHVLHITAVRCPPNTIDR